jgi:hypothetical protein
MSAAQSGHPDTLNDVRFRGFPVTPLKMQAFPAYLLADL